MKNNLLTLVLLIVSQHLFAQQMLTGTIDSWDGGKASVATGFGEPVLIGELNENGELKVPLDDAYMNKLKASIKKSNQQNSDWKTSLMTVERAFGNCGDKESVAITNGEETMITLTTQKSFMLVNMEEKKMYGYVMATSSREFADVLMSYGQKNAVKGYVLDWFYFEDDVSVKGSCGVESYTMTQKEEDIYVQKTNYDLQLKKGWNIVKYEYADLYEDSSGKIYPKVINYETIDKVPEETGFYFFPE